MTNLLDDTRGWYWPSHVAPGVKCAHYYTSIRPRIDTFTPICGDPRGIALGWQMCFNGAWQSYDPNTRAMVDVPKCRTCAIEHGGQKR